MPGRSGGNSPQLKSEINAFVKAHKVGTLYGNILVNKYIKTASHITGSVYGEHLKRFKETVPYFQKYAKQYGFDYLMLSAMGYQESKLDQHLKKPGGRRRGHADTAVNRERTKNVNIPDITKIDANIHAGTKYLRFMADRYFADADGDGQPSTGCFLPLPPTMPGRQRLPKSGSRRRQWG